MLSFDPPPGLEIERPMLAVSAAGATLPNTMFPVRARRLAILLAALVALAVAGCAGITTAPGVAGVGLQTRVGAFTPAAPTLIGQIGPGSACSRPSSAGSAAGLAAGFCVAAQDAGLNGEFSISDWSGYPDGVPRPTGPFRLLEGQEYADARAAANRANAALRSNLPADVRRAFEIHEIQPVKFGGDPVDIENKALVDRATHRQQLTPWWNAFQRGLGG